MKHSFEVNINDVNEWYYDYTFLTNLLKIMNMAKFGLHKNVVLCTAGYAKKNKKVSASKIFTIDI